MKNKLVTEFDSFVNESMSSKRQKFKSHRTPEPGMIYTVLDPKPGYYNSRKILSVDKDTETAEVVTVDVFNGQARTVGNKYNEFLGYIQKALDKEDERRHDKDEDARLVYVTLEKAVKSRSLKGGDLNDFGVRIEFEAALARCKKAMDGYTVDDSSVPAGGFSGANSTTMTSKQSGFAMSVSANDVHRGGYWGSTYPYVVQLRVGGGQSFQFTKAALRLFKEILGKYTFNTEYGNSSIREESGTAWSAVGIATAESDDNRYYTMPAMNDIANSINSLK